MLFDETAYWRWHNATVIICAVPDQIVSIHKDPHLYIQHQGSTAGQILVCILDDNLFRRFSLTQVACSIPDLEIGIKTDRIRTNIIFVFIFFIEDSNTDNINNVG